MTLAPKALPNLAHSSLQLLLTSCFLSSGLLRSFEGHHTFSYHLVAFTWRALAPPKSQLNHLFLEKASLSLQTQSYLCYLLSMVPYTSSHNTFSGLLTCTFLWSFDSRVSRPSLVWFAQHCSFSLHSARYIVHSQKIYMLAD